MKIRHLHAHTHTTRSVEHTPFARTHSHQVKSWVRFCGAKSGCATPSGAISFLFMCNSSKLGKQQLLRGKRRNTIFALLFITKRKPVSEVEEAIPRRQKCARAFHFHISHLNGSSENVMNKKSKQENILLSWSQGENK